MTLLFIIGFGVMVMSGCSNPTDSGDSAQVDGYATSESGNDGFEKISSGIEGATVTVVRMNAQGGFESVTDATATTNASGHFSLEADIEAEDNLIVRAEKEGQVWRSHISGTVENGNTVRTAPMTTETSVEAEIYAEMVAQGSADAWSVAAMKSEVNSHVAAEVHGNTSAYADLATAFQSKTEAEAQALAHSSIGLTSAQIEAIAKAKTEAQVELEADLYAAYGNQSQEDQAHKERDRKERESYASNGTDDGEQCKAHSISSKVLVQSAASLSGDARGALAQKMAFRTAAALDVAMQAQFEALGASSTEVNAAANAGADLRSSIRDAETSNEVKSAFISYHNAIIAELSNSSSIHVDGQVVGELDTAINSSTGAKAALESSLSVAISAGIDVSGVVNAYAQFFNAVKTTVESSLTSASDADVEAVVEAMILLNMSV